MTHLLKWDLRLNRRWSPLYTLNLKRYDAEPIPPIAVEFSAEFDDHETSLRFENELRALVTEYEASSPTPRQAQTSRAPSSPEPSDRKSRRSPESSDDQATCSRQ